MAFPGGDPPAAIPGKVVSTTYQQRVVELTRLRWWPMLAFCALYLVFELLRSYAVTADQRVWRDIGYTVFVLTTLPFVLFAALPMFAAIVLTEALGLRGARHFFLSFGGLVCAAVFGVAIMMWSFGGSLSGHFLATQVLVSEDLFIGRFVWLTLAAGMLFVVFLAYREREAESLRLANAALAQRTHTERATIAARLKVMQAQVEPSLLFGVLAEVRGLYLRDPSEADALLDDLIGYLRAALPQMRGEASTLGREAALAVAYLRVLPLARRGHLHAIDAVSQAVRDDPFPPMVLLPLVQAAAEEKVDRMTIEENVRVRIDPPRIVAGWKDERLAPLRTALAQYSGARIDVAPSGATIVQAAG